MIILASTSTARRSMLTNAGIRFDAKQPEVDERALVARNPQWLPRDIALHLAEAKALDVASRNPHRFVIGADQVLSLNEKVYTKPKDEKECVDALRELRGQTHQLISAVVLASGDEVVWSMTDHADLTMRDFSDDFLNRYVTTIGADCTTSVAGYKIEAIGIQLFEKIRGDYFTILGMPLLPLLQELRGRSVIPS